MQASCLPLCLVDPLHVNPDSQGLAAVEQNGMEMTRLPELRVSMSQSGCVTVYRAV